MLKILSGISTIIPGLWRSNCTMSRWVTPLLYTCRMASCHGGRRRMALAVVTVSLMGLHMNMKGSPHIRSSKVDEKRAPKGQGAYLPAVPYGPDVPRMGFEQHKNRISSIAEPSPAYGQIVVGTAGSGKSTYCKAMREYLQHTGRKVAIINMDPGNENIPYFCEVDIMELVSMYEVMEVMGLGPNGALVFCMEYIETNLDWLETKIQNLAKRGYYFLFDFPGQLELYAYHQMCPRILKVFRDKWELNLCAVYLVDAIHMKTPSNFLSACLLSLAVIVNLEVPIISLLSKFDVVMRSLKQNQSSVLPDMKEVYFTLNEVDQLLPSLDDELGAMQMHRPVMEKLVEVLTDYALLRYNPFSVFSSQLMQNMVRIADKALAYIPQEEYDKILQDRGLLDDWDKMAKDYWKGLAPHERELVMGSNRTQDDLDQMINDPT